MNRESNRTVVQSRIGPAPAAVEVVEGAIPVPGEGELLVELVLAPINPAEILMLEGSYGYGDTRPGIPRNAGIEGVGRVVGGATSQVPEGALVALAGSTAVFSDFQLIPVESAVVLDADVDPEVFAVSFVNAQAVLLMLHEWAELEPGDWIIQNAGNSAYGRILDVVAHRRGLSVLNVVRSEASAAKIAESARGPVLIDGEDLVDRVRELTGGPLPKVAVDAIGGAAAGRLAFALARGGRVVNYGMLSGDEIRVDNRLVLFNDIRVEGFWMPRSMGRITGEVLEQIRREALRVVAEEPISVPIQARFGLDEIADAIRLSSSAGRDGKVVLTR